MAERAKTVAVTVRGPGPHRVEHELGRHVIVSVFNDRLEERPAQVRQLDGAVEVSIGVFDLLSRQPSWVPDIDDAEYRIVVTG